MSINKKVIHEAGVTNPKTINNTFITGFENPNADAPKGNYSISESTNLTFTAGVIEKKKTPDLRLIKR